MLWVVMGAGTLLAAVPLVFLTTLSLWPRLLAILILAWWLPGILLALHWQLTSVPTPAWLLTAFGLGLCWMILGAYLIHCLPGPISLWLLLGVYEGGALVLLLTLTSRPLALPQAVSPAVWRWGAALLLLAVVLRLPGLGYHEFHADEAVLLRQASRSISGQDDALAEHTKGPGEIAVTLVFYRALNTATETTARLPFGLMSVGSIVAIAWLGRRLFSPAAGVWAAILLAANGFALGLSRIAQYQPAVLLLSALAVLAAWNLPNVLNRAGLRWPPLLAPLAWSCTTSLGCWRRPWASWSGSAGDVPRTNARS